MHVSPPYQNIWLFCVTDLKMNNELLTLNMQAASLKTEIRIYAKCIDSMQTKFLAAFFFFFGLPIKAGCLPRYTFF